MTVPTALTIAGSDSSGGAGIQADLKTIHQHGAYGAAVPTLLTVQNTEGVEDVVRVLGRPTGDAGTAAGEELPFPVRDEEPVAGSAARWIMDRLDLEGTRRDELRARWPGTEEAWTEGILALELAGKWR